MVHYSDDRIYRTGCLPNTKHTREVTFSYLISALLELSTPPDNMCEHDE